LAWCVLLHGLTDSPYSLRHIAKLYRERGFVAIGIRMPGHGTVPAGLTDVRLGRLDGGHAAGRARGAPARAQRRRRCIWSASRTAARWR
jgi:alpha-beta hydrolase superfamily lysophospholipase